MRKKFEAFRMSSIYSPFLWRVMYSELPSFRNSMLKSWAKNDWLKAMDVILAFHMVLSLNFRRFFLYFYSDWFQTCTVCVTSGVELCVQISTKSTKKKFPHRAGRHFSIFYNGALWGNCLFQDGFRWNLDKEFVPQGHVSTEILKIIGIKIKKKIAKNSVTNLNERTVESVCFICGVHDVDRP